MRIEPARRLRGRLRLPGDKSISHRAAMIAALAQQGTTRIDNFSTSADCASTLRCLARLGVGASREGNVVAIEGAGRRDGEFASPTNNEFASAPMLLRAAARPLDCGNSGSTMRMLAGVLAGQPFASVLTGDDSLRTRPMKRIIEPLTLMGARISSEEGGRAPLRIEGRRALQAIRYEMPVASAQVKSAILLAALFATGRTSVVERLAATRDHTERMLRWFGVPVEIDAGRGDTRETTRDSDFDTPPDGSRVVSVDGGASVAARDFNVPGDISSAAFLVAAATLLPGSELEIEGVGLNPTRAQMIETMLELGARIDVTEAREQCNEEVGNLRVYGVGRLAPTLGNRLSGAVAARLIDELPMLAVVGTQVDGGLEIREASELRVKESDRIGATVKNLRAMGAEVEEYADGLAVGGAVRLRGARLNAHDDHRIAMAFSVAALIAEGASEIDGAECVAVSFPEFFQLLEQLSER